MRRSQRLRPVLAVLICCCTYVPFYSLTKSFSLLEQAAIDKTLLSSRRTGARPALNATNASFNIIDGEQVKPFFVVHIGPVKSGTTTLQCALQSLSESLLHDKFVVAEAESCRPDYIQTSNLNWTKGGVATYDNVVLGKAFAPSCLGQWKENVTGMPDCWKDSYEKFAREHAQRNHSVIISNEIVSQLTSKIPASFVDDMLESLKDFRVVIVVTYRPWFEWVASLQDQMTKGVLEKVRDWPGHGNKRARKMEPLQNFVARQLRNRRQHRSTHTFPFVDDAIRIFQNHSGLQLEIVDIHKEGDFVTNFICKTLEGATITCDTLMSGNVGTIGDKNKAESKPWYDMLAVEAHERGLTSGSRLRVYRRIREFQEVTMDRTSTDFPKSCPSRSFLKHVLRESLQTEKKIYPKEQHRQMGRKHRAAFARLVESEKFCTINTTAVLNDRQWIDFFNSMKRQRPSTQIQ